MTDGRNGPEPTVLVADDDAGLRAAARMTLTAQGWTVIEASTPDECLSLARRHRPEVLLLDVNFEGYRRDGYSVCRELKAAHETRSIRIVLFTARDDPEGRAFASAVGASAFIVKPFGPMDLADLLQILLHGSKRDPGIGIHLIEAGVLRPAQLEQALAEQDRRRRGRRLPLGEILVRLGFATPEDVQKAVERQQRVRPIAVAAPRSGVVRRVVIADDNASVRDGLREAFASEKDFSLVGAAADGAEALRMIEQTKPDVVVLDNDMPRVAGMDVLRSVHARTPDTRVVMFTLNDSIRETALAAGAAAVVTKDTPIDSLLAELRRAGPAPRKSPRRSAVILTARGIPDGAGVLARRRQAIAAMGIVLVTYAGAFLLAEPALGASASLLAMLAVAIAGALFGPETGIATALLSTIVTAALWNATNHAIGEPVLRVGGNGIGVVALVAIGAGFGAMRLLRGRLVPRARLVGAFAEAAVALGPGLGPRTLELLAEAALEIVPGDVALIYVAVPGGGLELVAGVGAPEGVIGHREIAGAVAAAATQGRSSIVDDLEARPIGVSLPRSRSGLVVPVAGRGETPSGVIAVLGSRKAFYNASQLEALTSFAGFLSSVLNAPARAVSMADESILAASQSEVV